MRLMIVRHGDPDYENDTLTEKGKREAELLAKRLKKENITAIYTSPLGRAKDTCMYTAKALGMQEKVQEKWWLAEFNHFIDLPTGEKDHLLWDLLPDFWTKEEILSTDKWYDFPCMKERNVENAYKKVGQGLDELLSNHGYRRDGKIFQVENPNRDTVVLFCHFGLESVLLSHLFNCSPMFLFHHTVALTSSVTTLYTEERRKGRAIFRCCGFGDISHLYAGAESPSFSARFCEIYDCDERHD